MRKAENVRILFSSYYFMDHISGPPITRSNPHIQETYA